MITSGEIEPVKNGQIVQDASKSLENSRSRSGSRSGRKDKLVLSDRKT